MKALLFATLAQRMSWMKLTSPTGRTQYFNAENMIVFREVSGLEAAEGARSKLWLQNGSAQVREVPTDIIKQLGPGWIKLTLPSDIPIYFNPASCTEIGE